MAESPSKFNWLAVVALLILVGLVVLFPFIFCTIAVAIIILICLWYLTSKGFFEAR